MKENSVLISTINNEINAQLSDEATSRALLATTFKGLTPVTMKQAIMEGMIRGFTFKDFLEKRVYAIPYGQKYSLVTSVDHARSIGMRSGIVGKCAPVFEEENGKIISCTITVKRKIGEYVGDYTATVYMDEYTTGQNLWKTKPRTMLAKVAEMHALRMACPEELSQSYVEEEFEAEVISPTTARYETAKVASSSLKMKQTKVHEASKNQTQDETVINFDEMPEGDEAPEDRE